MDLIDKLLTRDPALRFGCGPPESDFDIHAVKNHPFFKNVDFRKISYISPPIPMH
jgi:3-phosphoinositide dependent protein kinase-1